MKIITFFGALTVFVLCFSAPRANAQLACVTTPPFCDRIEIVGMQDGVLTGLYDFECNGAFSSPVIGRLSLSPLHVTFAGPAWNPEATYFSDLDLANRTEDFWSWDGVVVTQHVFDSPFDLTLGPCPPAEAGGRSRVDAE